MTIEAYSAVTVSDVSNNPIVSVDVLYNLSSSNTTPPSANDANWKTEADQWEDGKYFWQRTITTFKNGDVLKSDPVCITGGKGQTGVGIKSIKEQYYKSTSSSSTAGGSWISSPPEWEDGYYIWTRSEIIYSDDTTDYTSPILNQYYKSIIDKILNVESVVDKQEGIIKDKVSVTEFEEKIGEYDGKIETINTTVAEHTTSIGNITSQVNTLETTVSDNKTTMDEKIAKLELTDSNITSTVSNVKTQLDNLEVGGRNLFVSSYCKFTGDTQNGYQVRTWGNAFVENEHLILMLEPSTEYTIQYKYKLLSLVEGTVPYRGDRHGTLFLNGTESIRLCDSEINTVTEASTWTVGSVVQRSYTFTTPDDLLDTSKKYTIISYSRNSCVDASTFGTTESGLFYDIKIEKGNIMTDYTPAPEDTAKEINSVRTIAEQTAEGFSWIVESGEDETSLVLTDGAIDAVTDKFVIKSPDGKRTVISGGLLSTDAIKSNNYAKASSNTTPYSDSGSFFDLENGSIISKNFGITSDGSAYFNGSISIGQVSDWDSELEVINGNIQDVENQMSNKIIELNAKYGTCTTAATTATKIVTCENFPDLYKGASIFVKFTNKNNVTNPTLNVNGTGAKPIYAYGSALATSKYYWTAGATVQFIYNGTQWELSDNGGLDKTNNAYLLANTANGTASQANATANSLDGTIANWCYNNDRTYINGGNLYTGTVTSKQLSTDAIKSNNYSYSSGTYSTAGTFLDLADGAFRSKNFAIDSSGNAYFNGSIILGQVSDWNTKESGINSNISSAKNEAINTAKTNSESYTDGQINALPNVAKTGSYNDLSDKPTIPSLEGYIYQDGTIGLTPEDGATGFVVSSQGLLQASNAVIYGTVYASAGEIGGCLIENGKLIIPTANITGTLAVGNVSGLETQLSNINNSISGISSIANDAHDIASLKFATCTSLATAQRKIASIGDFILFNGATIWVHFKYKNSVDNPMLGTSLTSAKPIYAYGSPLTADSPYNWEDDSTVLFVYDSTNSRWEITDSSGLIKANNALMSAQEAHGVLANWCYDNDTTYIDGGNIYAGTVSAKLLNSECLTSFNYVNNPDSVFSNSGTRIYLGEEGTSSTIPGYIKSQNFAIDSNGNAYLRGEIEATSFTANDYYQLYFNGWDTKTSIIAKAMHTEYTGEISGARNIIRLGLFLEDTFDDESVDSRKAYIDIYNDSGGGNSYYGVKVNGTLECDTFFPIDVYNGAFHHVTLDKFSVLEGSMAIKGTNTYTSSSDTVSSWTNESISYHYYNNTGTLASKPNSYGFLLNYANTSNVHQIWLGQPNGVMAHRSGNANGWGDDEGNGSWKTILDSSNYTSYRHDRLISGSHGTSVYASGNTPFFIPINNSGDYIDGVMHLGGSSDRWKNVYATNGTIQTSDKNEKHSIQSISSAYEDFFMKLRPVTYMWNKQSENDTHVHDRIHCGLISQQMNEAAESVGLSSITVAAICRDDLDEPTFDGRTERWGINYSELHGIEIHMIQKTIKHQEKQDEEIALLKAQIIELSERLNKLEAKG